MEHVFKKIRLIEERLRNHYGKHVLAELVFNSSGSGCVKINRVLCDDKSIDLLYVFNFDNYSKLKEWAQNEGVSGCLEKRNWT